MAGSDATAVRAVLARHRVRVLQVDDLDGVVRELERAEADSTRVGRTAQSGRTILVRLDDVVGEAASLLHQEFHSLGGEVTPGLETVRRPAPPSAVVLEGTLGQFGQLPAQLDRQPFELPDIGRAVAAAIANFGHRGSRTIQGPHHSVVLGGYPKVMGVVNVTPDSFSDGGRFLAPADAIAHAKQLVAEGAVVLDVGAESTRPGAAEVTPEAEWKRLEPVLAGLHGQLEVPVSVDTRHPEVAAKALDAGADWVNDVGGLRDPEMRRVVARTGAPVVVLHMRGDPTTMQTNTVYDDVRDEVYGALAAATEQAIADGVAPSQLLVDPGLGFGKSAEQSLELLEHVGEFRSLGYPVVVGASRKSFLGAVTGGRPVHDRVDASVAAAVLAAVRGAELIRAHDVQPTVRALAVVAAARRAHRPTTSVPALSDR
ncbi:MAG TPA: dihydropteroate synthase [Thermoplasmata archaeon]|nr:dihydropteroate synthase [Thermoplasmata archaeon]